MKTLRSFFLLVSLTVPFHVHLAQEHAASEEIRDVSPDKKFGVGILFNAKPENAKKPDLISITDVDLVSLPSKAKVMEIPTNERVPHLVWSSDSNWFAFPLYEPRTSDTHIYHRTGDNFAEFETNRLAVDVAGDVRTERVTPIRWLKPGLLLLKDEVMFRDGADATVRFTARFDEKTGETKIISKKKRAPGSKED